jgi:hypothetical protein
MGAGIDDICTVLGLGAPGDPPELVAGGSSAARWRVRTARGRWLVKTTPAPAAWQRQEMRVSGRLERAAYEAGVPMPAPARPVTALSMPAKPAETRSAVTGIAGYWVRLDEDGRYARASAWIVGGPCAGPASESLAAWLGRTIAAIERLHLPGDPSAEAAYPVHPVPDWQEWLGQAVSAGILRRPRALAVLDAITDGTALVREALAGNPVFRLAHRDVSRSNIVVTAGGPVLIDFDYAGPEVPWWEFVHHGFSLASPALGEQPPRPELIHVALASYAEAGGVPGPARAEAFAGLVRAMLSTLAYELWLAAGHRAASPDRRAAATRSVRQLAVRLPGVLSSLGSWSDLIR